jgi:AcrR family transcriptional regulator
MSEEKSSVPGSVSSARKPRADALRNREHIVRVAREAFTERGDSVTLEEVVEKSGLGTGTLYRHFPTRDALIEAVYRADLDQLASAQREFAESLPPVEALRSWLLAFVDFLGTKIAMREALQWTWNRSTYCVRLPGWHTTAPARIGRPARDGWSTS